MALHSVYCTYSAVVVIIVYFFDPYTFTHAHSQLGQLEVQYLAQGFFNVNGGVMKSATDLPVRVGRVCRILSSVAQEQVGFNMDGQD